MSEHDQSSRIEKSYAVNRKKRVTHKPKTKESSGISISKDRITYLTLHGKRKIIVLSRQNKYHQLILSAYAAGLQSEWFKGLSPVTKRTYLDAIRKLFDWINKSNYETTDENRYSLLKNHEAFELNERGLKISPITYLRVVLVEASSIRMLTTAEHDYLAKLLSLSKPAMIPESTPRTLGGWFNLPWMKFVIGENDYLSLESPRRLIRSFRVTAATTLIWFLEQRKVWQSIVLPKFDYSYSNWHQDWSRLLFQELIELEKHNCLENDIYELAYFDMVKPGARDLLKKKLIDTPLRDIPKKFSFGNTRQHPWMKPIFFLPSNRDTYSQCEEMLCAWLLACQAIQPSDICKLKKSNFAFERNHLGRLVAMECTYYKGRAGSHKQPGLLMGSELWTQALEMYLEELEGDSLFQTDVLSGIRIPAMKPAETGMHRNTIFTLLLRIWESERFQKRLNKELKRVGATPVFVKAMLALKEGGKTHGQHCTESETYISAAEYSKSRTRPLPLQLFSLTHIKTTAVHANSDMYRDSDLINIHSHSAQTEKASYLTDANKAWVNQASRITRLVINDLMNVVYQPSLLTIQNDVNNLNANTKVVQATGSADAATQSIHVLSKSINHKKTIVVLDTIDSAMYFIHYIKQAESKYKHLVATRPDWVERTLIIQLEWMSSTLKRMKCAASAQETYSKLAAHLPPLFDHLEHTLE